jgi:hypothetical protein
MKYTIAIAIALAASPASACTDWKAVAALDVIIAANDREAVKSEVANWDKGTPDFPSCAVRGQRGKGHSHQER